MGKGIGFMWGLVSWGIGFIGEGGLVYEGGGLVAVQCFA